MDTNNSLHLLQLLMARLERISADSIWAHRASGIRGALIEAIELLEIGHPMNKSKVDAITLIGFQILEKTAEDLS